MANRTKVGVLHGGGYVGMWMIELILRHPKAELTVVTSRSGGGQPLHSVHPMLFGKTHLNFTAPEDANLHECEAVFITAEHKQAVYVVQDLLNSGYEGKIIDLSADFRFNDASLSPRWFGYEHPNPALLNQFVYGLAEVNGAAIQSTHYVANPGCFATALNLAMYPISKHLPGTHLHITAITGASGSGNKASVGTHFPNRSGNMRTYKVFNHQHQPELDMVLGSDISYSFVPSSGPWTYGIWATLQFRSEVTKEALAKWYHEAYAGFDCIRIWDQVPELLPVVGTPFCDLGWTVRDGNVVIGVAIDNLWKGAASQAVQNFNLMMGWPDALGLLPNVKD